MPRIELDARRDLPKPADLPARIRPWMIRNKESFGTGNGYPGAFHREELFSQVEVGSTVAWVTPHGGVSTGKVYIRQKHHVVAGLTGSRHGQPYCVDADNIIWVSGARDTARSQEVRRCLKRLLK